MHGERGGAPDRGCRELRSKIEFYGGLLRLIRREEKRRQKIGDLRPVTLRVNGDHLRDVKIVVD